MISILISVFILTMMEIVLGVDNIIFIGFLVNSLEDKRQANIARRTGLAIALVVRVVALLFISYLAHMTEPVFSITTAKGFAHPVSIRDTILFLGGLFLIHKSASEIHAMFEEEKAEEHKQGAMLKVILQIVLIDLVFSADSILTAIGLVDKVEIMIAAVVISMGLMFFLSGKIADFIDARPSLKVLALAFLITIGVTLVMEGAGVEVDKAYIYFAMAFAGVIEALNTKLKMRPTRNNVKKGKETAALEEHKEVE